MNFWKRSMNTTFKRLFIPVMSILLLQALIYIGVFFQGGMVDRAKENARDIMIEKVINRHIYLENDMVRRWSVLGEAEERVAGQVRAALRQNRASVKDIATGVELNKKIVADCTDNLIYLLRRNAVTGAFLVLDGMAVAGEENTRAGLYLRDLTPQSMESSTHDLLLERGMPDISKSRGIPLDTYWESCFRFAGPDVANEAFFHAPLAAVRADMDEYTGAENYGYWAPGMALNSRDMSVITYSIPLVVDGMAIGVLGVDISATQLNGYLNYDELGDSKMGAYVLGVMDTQEGKLRRVLSNGPMYRAYFGLGDEITIQTDDHDMIALHSSLNPNARLLGVVKPLHLYDSNTPFADEQWVLVGIMRENDLMEYANSMRSLIYISTLISLVLGIAGVFLASETITRPIASLARDLQDTDPEQPIHLDKLNIVEIDLLSQSIEDLSRSVAESAAKMSKTIEMINLPIGLFEHNLTTRRVFCSQRWFEYAVGRKSGSDEGHISQEEFFAHWDALRPYAMPDEPGLYCVPREGGDQWLRYISRQEGNLVLGALTDVTKEILERKKLAYERDYDVLTDLYNRRAFQEKAAELFSRPDKLGIGALVMWDLDNLKYVNDTFGHAVGDAYICAFADIIRGFDPEHTLVARRSGDEFYALLYGYDREQDVDSELKKIWDVVRRTNWPLPEGREGYMRIRASGGIAWYPKDANDLEELIKYADFAMYNVKHTSKGRIQDFNRETYLSNAVLVSGTEALNQLIENRLVHYAFQPIYRTSTGEVYGYEMLMRSNMAELPSPYDVLRLADAQSKLGEIEQMTFFMAMGTYKTFVEEGKIAPDSKVFINSVAGQLLSPQDEVRFAKEFRPYLKNLVVEFTEEQPTTHDMIKHKADVIRSWGAGLALDDYGSGYNSEAILLHFAPDIVKVDISIIGGIDKDVDRQTVMMNLLSYARPRGIEVLAEGVETAMEMETLVEMGVDYVQGYYFARPAPQADHKNGFAIDRMVEIYRKLHGG